jgi:hypothetical protein
MRSFGALLVFIVLTMIAWGVYGPVVREGQIGMEGSSLRPFICVGLAYFFIAVLAPGILLRTSGEVGHWSTTGTVWSLLAGAAGAIGALGIILALAFRGSPLYVMPLVFGGAPVVNTFLTMYWARSYKHVSPWFLAGLILVICGAVSVLVFRPQGHGPAGEKITITQKGANISVDVTHSGDESPTHYEAASVEALEHDHPDIFKLYNVHRRFTVRELALVVLFTVMTAVAWGVYGPTLHRGQMAMAGSRLRPLMCVGAAYFLIAVIVPTLLLMRWDEPGRFTVSGTIWSLGGGTAGALGALGIIMAFTFGGKPIFVMPLVFGGAPVINTFVGVMQAGNWNQLHPLFFAGLIVVAAGAVSVLVFAPKADTHAAPSKSAPAKETAPA